ncbi:DUF3883 domain-containing protein [Fluviicola sp.]|uniref:DUF3883 domain-containing protein n=1 Tax=Fluviicola sp. TaxID=1917219 RepID=UPI0031DA3EB9
MSKNEQFSISNSNIIALWQLILLTHRHEEIEVRSAVEIAMNSGLMGGSLPVNQGLKLGQYCKVLEINDSFLQSSQYCKNELLRYCTEDEPNVFVFREILQRFTSFQNLEWLLFYSEDPELFKIYIPSEWIELLENAVLFDFEDIDVRDWWAKIFNRYQNYKEGQKLEIGRVAEKLTYEHEKQRLEFDQLDNGHSYVKWASLISDRYGYDILSIRGKALQQSFGEKDSIHIEVKCSVSDNETNFRFYVTSNEWNVATTMIDSYYFYCWTSANKETESAIGPYVIPALHLKSHIPTNNGAICEWSECRFILDLNKFSIINGITPETRFN